jgi:peptidoglycan hydrolase-like protein with peptidoglycan-binding domain
MPSRSALWVLVKVLGEQAFLYQEPEGVVSMPLVQVRQVWSGKLYLTMEGTKYRGFALRPGMNGERVRVLQETLRDKGYFTGTASGQFDVQTQQAVKRFQRHNLLVADGYVGRQTLLMLLHFGGETLAHTT